MPQFPTHTPYPTTQPPNHPHTTTHPHICARRSPRVRELRLYDVANTAGVAADLSHIATAPRLTAHTGPAQLGDALYGADLVVIPAGVPRKPGMTRDDLFNINAGIGGGGGAVGLVPGWL